MGRPYSPFSHDSNQRIQREAAAEYIRITEAHPCRLIRDGVMLAAGPTRESLARLRGDYGGEVVP